MSASFTQEKNGMCVQKVTLNIRTSKRIFFFSYEFHEFHIIDVPNNI